jgi:hypothetical protein
VTDIIDFLEKLGQDSQLRHADSGEIRQALSEAGIDPLAAAALVAGDERKLAEQLGARSDLCCLVYAPRRDDEEEKEGEVPAEEDAPEENGPKSQRSNERRVA